ncbi:MAG: glycoside hydrolase family 32 protein [bacterium]
MPENKIPSNLKELIADQRTMRDTLLVDPHRPTWHFVAPEGYGMPFDPNGAIYWNKHYHLCYIYQDPTYPNGGHCWGHASSLDLLHWHWHIPALVPAPGDVDNGIFSGNCFINKDGQATMLYHGVNAGNCIATSSEPDLNNWTKLAANPIIPNPLPDSPESKIYNSWDPHGWVENGTYYAVFGGNPSTCTPASLFKAQEIDKWQYVGPFLAHDMPEIESFEDISCPDFFELDNKHVLVCISHSCGARYYVGKWENEKFYPEYHQRMNYPGGSCFAPESLLDDKGRRIMWTWALEARPADKSSWGGTMTLPRVLSLAPDNSLFIDPIEELDQLRYNMRGLRNLRVTADEPIHLEDIKGDSLEMEIIVHPKGAARFGLKVRCSPDGEEETAIWCDFSYGTLSIDVAKSSLDKDIIYRTYVMKGGENPQVTIQTAPFILNSGEPLKLRVFIDKSILEVFANRRECLTQRIYPTLPDSMGVQLFSEGGDCSIESITAWEMTSANAW